MKDNSFLATGEVYHVFTRSIAGYKIFNNNKEFSRMVNCLSYYKVDDHSVKFSRFIEYGENGVSQERKNLPLNNNLVDIVAFCVMPTHIHLVLKQIKDNGISIFMSNILNSYSRYFNIKNNRKGPLWEGRFKKVLVDSDEQLLHLTRYVHLNPVTAFLVNSPKNWAASSYGEYVGEKNENNVCNFKEILEIDPISYSLFVEDRIAYQRELAKIKSLTFD